ncbi:flagellar basal body-associated protein FliL [Lysinibacillus sp. KU-BSD001]|uniref:flagellar basal body-associated protein FliL n=1 Tax=Lysinibacillus sp. KU-BSD001 TaxID=3141328 RepID=UPI0036EE04B9
MKKNKLLTIMLIIIAALALVGVIAFVLLTQLNKEPEVKETSIEEVLLASVDIPEIRTNLADGHYAVLQLKIQTESEDAATELTQRIFQVNNIVIQELSEMTQEDLQGKQGKILFEKAIKAKMNELMQEGEVQQVYITSFIIQ